MTLSSQHVKFEVPPASHYTASYQPSHIKQMTLHNLQQKRKTVAKCIATPCRPINVIEDECLCKIARIASNDPSCQIPSRATPVKSISELYEKEKAKTGRRWKRQMLWCSLGFTGLHNYLGPQDIILHQSGN